MITDQAARRRLQNRIAQQTYRRNRKNRAEKLEKERQKAANQHDLTSTTAGTSQQETITQERSDSNRPGDGDLMQQRKPSHMLSPPLSEYHPILTHHHYIKQPSPSQYQSPNLPHLDLSHSNGQKWEPVSGFLSPTEVPTAFMTDLQEHTYYEHALQDTSSLNRSMHMDGPLFGDDMINAHYITDTDLGDQERLAFSPVEEAAPSSNQSYEPSYSPVNSLNFLMDVKGKKPASTDETTYPHEAPNPSLAEITPKETAEGVDRSESADPKARAGSCHEEQDAGGGTPLHDAVYHGHESIVRILLENGADAGLWNARGLTTLHLAADMGHHNVVALLLSRGIDVNVKDTDGQTTLHHAAKHGNQALVRLLLENSAQVNTTDSCGRTALHMASQQGHLPAIRLLLEHRININAKDDSGWTALHHAAEYGREAAVRLLIERGANINARIN